MSLFYWQAPNGDEVYINFKHVSRAEWDHEKREMKLYFHAATTVIAQTYTGGVAEKIRDWLKDGYC